MLIFTSPSYRRYLRFTGPGAFPIRCDPLWHHQCPSSVHKSLVGVPAHLWRSGVLVFPVPRRLAAKDVLAPGSHHPPPDFGGPLNIAGVQYKHAKVTSDSFTDAAIHLGHSGHSAISRLSPGSESPGHLGYDADVSTSVLDFSEDDAKAAGTDGLLQPTGQAHQVT